MPASRSRSRSPGHAAIAGSTGSVIATPQLTTLAAAGAPPAGFKDQGGVCVWGTSNMVFPVTPFSGVPRLCSHLLALWEHKQMTPTACVTRAGGRVVSADGIDASRFKDGSPDSSDGGGGGGLWRAHRQCVSECGGVEGGRVCTSSTITASTSTLLLLSDLARSSQGSQGA